MNPESQPQSEGVGNVEPGEQVALFVEENPELINQISRNLKTDGFYLDINAKDALDVIVPHIDDLIYETNRNAGRTRNDSPDMIAVAKAAAKFYVEQKRNSNHRKD